MLLLVSLLVIKKNDLLFYKSIRILKTTKLMLDTVAFVVRKDTARRVLTTNAIFNVLRNINGKLTIKEKK